ncbi:hypothetical protein TNCV_340741 [Trichonephila clavipes]|uniref:Uncharacterized protein n=1 Tax=Trichonephila clavipes TaxID=2585209 RepID=A0A8X6VQD9_TRICX|nr:hypothetical protein TNCV_340741 [Trichonephila clavipes]
MPSDMDTSIESETNSRCGSPAPPPPRLEDIRKISRKHTTPAMGKAHGKRTCRICPGGDQKTKEQNPLANERILVGQKPRTSCDNKFEALTLEDPPTEQQDNEMEEDDVTPSRSSTPIPKVRPPPPITIDDIAQPAQLLKKKYKT